jgi:cell division protein FtsL
MSIETKWKQMNDNDDDEELSSLLNQKKLHSLSSKSPLQKLKRSLLINIISGIIICFAYIIIIAVFYIWQVQLALFIVLVFSAWTVYSAFLQYKKLQASVTSGPVLTELKRHHESFTKWIALQLRVSVGVYPISVSGGFMLGGVLGSNKPIEVFMSRSVVQIALLICIIVMVPAAYYLAKWLFHLSFGKHLKLLKQNIEDLEKEI